MNAKKMYYKVTTQTSKLLDYLKKIKFIIPRNDRTFVDSNLKISRTEQFMTNNDILKKLRVALHLRDEEIVQILTLVNYTVTKSELSAIFRKEDHPNYRECGDQLLRNFLNGLIIHLRGPINGPKRDEKEE